MIDLSKQALGVALDDDGFICAVVDINEDHKERFSGRQLVYFDNNFLGYSFYRISFAKKYQSKAKFLLNQTRLPCITLNTNNSSLYKLD